MSTKFKFLGFSSFLITTSSGTDILIDPYLNDNPVSPVKASGFEKVDLLLVSHGAFDHLGDSAEIAKHYGCPVICSGDSKLLLLERGVDKAQLIETTWGLTVKAAGIKVRPVESRHRSCVTLQNGCVVTANPLGFIIYTEDDTRIYNASDTALFTDLKLIGELHRPHIGLMNVTIENPFDFLPEFLTGEMTAYEAALASQWLRLDYAVACHYTQKDCEDIQIFINQLENTRSGERPYTKPIAMDAGQTFEYAPGGIAKVY